MKSKHQYDKSEYNWIQGCQHSLTVSSNPFNNPHHTVLGHIVVYYNYTMQFNFITSMHKCKNIHKTQIQKK